MISGFLKNIGWNVRESIGRTGVIADFGPLDKGIVGLRVDMDALPIFEETKLSFSSKVDGVMLVVTICIFRLDWVSQKLLRI